MKLSGFSVFILSLIAIPSIAQDVSARLSVINGGRIYFPFNSISDYETGITLTEATTLGVTISDDNGVGTPAATAAPDIVTGFSITVESSSTSGGDLVGDGGGTMDADYITITPINNLGLGAATLTSRTLSGAAQTIVSLGSYLNCAWNTHQINITYVCSSTEPGGNGLMSVPPDYYSATIFFDLDVNVTP